MSFYRILILAAALSSCKTSSRGDFSTGISDISVKIPAEMNLYESKISFSRVDSKADPKVVRGHDVRLKLPTGIYKVELVLTSKDGTEEFVSCENSRTFTFSAAQEDVIIDICRRSDRALVTKTLPSIKVVVVDPPVVKPPVVTPPVIDPPVIPPPVIVPVVPPVVKPKPDAPTFESGTECFGLAATFAQETNEIVIKTADAIKNHVFELGNYLRCSVTVLIPKAKGQGLAPFTYRMQFLANDATIAQNLYITTNAKDDKGVLLSPCKTMLLSSAGNSGNSYECAFYDTTPGRDRTILERNKVPYDTSCKADSQKIKIELTLAGKTGALIEDLKIPELRIQIPSSEVCITSQTNN